MEQIHIAIIDDEIQTSYTKEYKIEKVRFVPQGIGEEKESFSHATICFFVLEKYLSVPVKYSNLIVLDQSERCSVAYMIRALDWCENNDVNLINLSLGSINVSDSFALRQVVNRLTNKGIIIVGATDNEGYLTYPACFTNVIGVKADRKGKLKEGEWTYNNETDIYDGVEITAHSEFPLKI